MINSSPSSPNPDASIGEKKYNKNHYKWLLTLPILLGTLGIWHFFHQSSDPVAQTQPQNSPRPVRTVTLTAQEGKQSVKLLGQVEAGETATVRSQTNGLVRQVLVKEGDRVEAGMTLVILEDTDQQVSLSQAEAQLAKEKSQLEKLTVGTRPEVIAQRRADVNGAIAREREARANLQSIITLSPDLIAQREAELKMAIARVRETQDNLNRIKGLAQEGAFPQRALVEAETAVDTATSDKLRAEAALTAEKIRMKQTESEAKTTLEATINERRRLEASLQEAIAGPTVEEIAMQRSLVAAAVAAVKQAQLQLGRVEIKASTSGIVKERTVDTGDYVESSDAVITLVSDQQLEIFLEVPETLISQISPGLPVSLSARALPQWQATVPITAVVPAADPSSRRQLIRLNLENPPKNLLAGTAVQGELSLPLPTTADTFIIPRDALIRRGDRWFIYTIVEDQAQQLEVTMVSDLGERVAVNSPDLKMGQKMVVTGGEALRDGSKVKITD